MDHAFPFKALAGCGGLQYLPQTGDQFRKLHRQGADDEFPAFDLADVQHVVHQLLQVPARGLNLFQSVPNPIRLSEMVLRNAHQAHNDVHRGADIMAHPGQKCRFCRISLVGLLRCHDPVLLPALFVGDQLGHIEYLGNGSVLVPVFRNEPGQVPVSIGGRIFDGNGLLMGHPLRQGLQIEEFLHPVGVSRHHEGIAQRIHLAGRLSGHTGEPVDGLLGGDFLVKIPLQVDTINCHIDFTDGGDDLIVQRSLHQRLF